MSRKSIVGWTIFAVLLIDQLLKVYVKTNIVYGQGFDIMGLSWAKIHFIENPGMAFGITFGGEFGKYALSIFRILMVGFLFYLIASLIKVKESKTLICAFSLIIAGAIGNILDSMFYGLIFSGSSPHGNSLAEFVSFGEGYAPFLQGKVVDMFYFPMVDTILPEWVPFWGGQRFEFFRPVFNVADSAISVGVAWILLFHRKFFTKDSNSETKKTATVSEEALNVAIPVEGSKEEE